MIKKRQRHSASCTSILDIYSKHQPDPKHADLEEADQCFTSTRNEYTEPYTPKEWTDISPLVPRSSIVKELKRTKNTAPGDDGIFYCHVKNLPCSALDYLAEIFETCLTLCYFPRMWKHGITKLIPKPGKDPTLAPNYRPITLLPALGKVLERILKTKLTDFLEDNSIIPESQAGFRSRRSTQDQLFKLAQDACESIVTDHVTIASFFDVEKAYDRVWREGLALKMSRTAIPKPMTAIIFDYLSERSIKLTVGSAISEEVQLYSGIAQGSIVAPTIFNLWVSDAPQPRRNQLNQLDPSERTANLSQFADDMATWANAKRISVARRRLQEYNDELMEWCRTWKIKLSSAKSQVIGFGCKTKDDIYQTIDGHRIEHEDTVKFLGLFFDSDMKWKTQTDHQIKQLKQRIGLFSGITGSVSAPRADNDICLKILKYMI